MIALYFFFNDTATTEIYTLSLHDALPISPRAAAASPSISAPTAGAASPRRSTASSRASRPTPIATRTRSEEHTSELQSRQYLVCRLLLEKKKISQYYANRTKALVTGSASI